jgi:hypothetical protein
MGSFPSSLLPKLSFLLQSPDRPSTCALPHHQSSNLERCCCCFPIQPRLGLNRPSSRNSLEPLRAFRLGLVVHEQGPWCPYRFGSRRTVSFHQEGSSLSSPFPRHPLDQSLTWSSSSFDRQSISGSSSVVVFANPVPSPLQPPSPLRTTTPSSPKRTSSLRASPTVCAISAQRSWLMPRRAWCVLPFPSSLISALCFR